MDGALNICLWVHAELLGRCLLVSASGMMLVPL